MSSTPGPELSPGPVDNGLSAVPPRRLDSPLGRSTGDDTEPVRPSRGAGHAPRRTDVVRRCRWSPLASLLSQSSARMGRRREQREELLREHHRAGVVGRPGAARAAQRQRGDDWGDGPAAYEPGERPSRPGDRTPPQDNAAEQSVLGSMLLSKDSIADVSEVAARRWTSTGRSTRSSSTRSSTSTAAASRPTRSPSATSSSGAASWPASAAPPTSTRCRPTSRSPPTPATTPRSSARRRSCGGWSTPAPGSCRWATPAQGQVDDVVDSAQAEVYQVTDRRTAEDYAPLSRHHGRRPRRDRGDRQPRGRPLRRARPASPTSTT